MKLPWSREGVTIAKLSATRDAQRFGEDIQILGGHAAAIAKLRGTLLRLVQFRGPWRVLEESRDHSRDSSRIGWIEIHCPVGSYLSKAGQLAAQDGFAASHRLEDGQAEALVQRREDQGRARIEQRKKLGFTDIPGEDDLV